MKKMLENPKIKDPPGRRFPPAVKLSNIVQLLGGNHITREYEIRGWEILYLRIDGYG